MESFHPVPQSSKLSSLMRTDWQAVFLPVVSEIAPHLIGVFRGVRRAGAVESTGRSIARVGRRAGGKREKSADGESREEQSEKCLLHDCSLACRIREINQDSLTYSITFEV